MMQIFTRIVCLTLILLVVSSSLPVNAGIAANTTITLNPKTTYQTITGWEAVAQAGQLECAIDPATGKYDPLLFAAYKESLFDQAVADGINRIRLEVRSGSENPVDYFSLYLSGQITRQEWKAHWHDIVNDNNNPHQINDAGFQFAEIDNQIEQVILPLKERLEARGETLFLNVNYVDFSGSTFEHKDAPEEYAEFVLAAVKHMKAEYNLVPDAWEVILEPDTGAAWSGTQIGQAIAAAGARLKAEGIPMRFIGPSTTNMTNAISYFDQVIAVPGAREYLSEISYHRYGGVSGISLQAIAARSAKYKLQTSMLEHIGSGYEDLHEDLKIGLNSSWQQFTLGYCGTDDGGAYYTIDQTDLRRPRVIIGSRTKFLRQYFKFIRPGAVRLGATGGGAFDPLAFINPGNKYVVVVKAASGGSFAVQNLPAGTYGIKYTTNTTYDVSLPAVTLSAGQSLTAAIPAAGVLTVYQMLPQNPQRKYFPLLIQMRWPRSD
jgi:hypothetical protein